MFIELPKSRITSSMYQQKCINANLLIVLSPIFNATVVFRIGEKNGGGGGCSDKIIVSFRL